MNTDSSIANKILKYLSDKNTATRSEIYEHVFEPFSNNSNLNLDDFTPTIEELKDEGLIEEMNNLYKINSKGYKVIAGNSYENYILNQNKKKDKEKEKLDAELQFINASNKLIPFQKRTTWINLILVLISTLFVAYSIYQAEKKDTDIENIKIKITELEKKINTLITIH